MCYITSLAKMKALIQKQHKLCACIAIAIRECNLWEGWSFKMQDKIFAARVYGGVQHPPPPPHPPPPHNWLIFMFWHLKCNTKLQWYTTYWWGGEGGGRGSPSFIQASLPLHIEVYKSIIWQDTGIGTCKRDIHNARDHLMITCIWLGAVHKLRHAEGEEGVSASVTLSRHQYGIICDEGRGGGSIMVKNSVT